DPAMEARLAWLAGQALPAGLREALATQAFASEYVWGGEGLGVPPVAAAEIAEERRLAAAMPSLGDSSDHTSRAVRAQYEANPYPRWCASAARPHVSVAGHLAALGTPQAGPLEVLVAGCGTGFEPIDLARMDSSLAITALDLSAASLAYGARMAGALGIGGVRFVQGDILDVAKLGRRFGLVSSTGVLHHMERPADGLAALAGVLAPGGVLRIAL
ncbi:class I SAM-dependent methyltransferase, partial [Escherichia coli]|nr:class I SAM-dependent methyltransferase [Escherichia coli]